MESRRLTMIGCKGRSFHAIIIEDRLSHHLVCSHFFTLLQQPASLTVFLICSRAMKKHKFVAPLSLS